MPTRLVEFALEGWREAERLLDELAPDSPARKAVEQSLVTLRDGYRYLVTDPDGTGERFGPTLRDVDQARAVIRAIRARRAAADTEGERP